MSAQLAMMSCTVAKMNVPICRTLSDSADEIYETVRLSVWNENERQWRAYS